MSFYKVRIRLFPTKQPSSWVDLAAWAAIAPLLLFASCLGKHYMRQQVVDKQCPEKQHLGPSDTQHRTESLASLERILIAAVFPVELAIAVAFDVVDIVAVVAVADKTFREDNYSYCIAEDRADDIAYMDPSLAEATDHHLAKQDMGTVDMEPVAAASYNVVVELRRGSTLLAVDLVFVDLAGAEAEPCFPIFVLRRKESEKMSIVSHQSTNRQQQSNGSSSGVNSSAASSWTEHKTRDGINRRYWYNAVTRKSVWQKPEELKTPTEKLLDLLPWREYTAPDGRKYWHNAKTNTSNWSCPEELVELLQRVEDEQQQKEAQSGSSSPVDSTAAVNNQTGGSLVPGSSSQSLSTAVKPSDTVAPSATDNEQIPIFFTKQEAESAFIKMLEECDIPSSWSWDQCMRAIVNKPMYKSLRTVVERREAFEKYQENKRIVERDRALQNATRNRDVFKKFLIDNEIVEPDSRYGDVEALYSTRDEWKGCRDDRERRDIFEELLHQVKKDTRESERLQREQDLESIKLIFPLIEITAMTTWDEFYERFTAHELYNEHPHLKEADLRELLDMFEAKAKMFEEQERDRIRDEQAAKYRQDRRFRDAYRDLLMELKNNGTLDAHTKWKDLHQIIKDDDKYRNMFSQPGSTPLEIYRDFIVDMEEEVFLKGRYVQSFIKHSGYLIEPESQYEKFHDHVRAHNLDVTDAHLKIIFQVLVDKAVAKHEEQKHRQEKRKKYIWQSFKYFIKNGEMPVTAQTSFDEIRASFGYLMDCDLPTLKVMYHKYMEKLQSDTLSEPDQDVVDEIESRQRERRRPLDSSGDTNVRPEKRAKYHRREPSRPASDTIPTIAAAEEKEPADIDYDG